MLLYIITRLSKNQDNIKIIRRIKMIIMEISTQSYDERYPETNNRPYFYRNSENYTPAEWKQLLKCLKRNAEAGLLKLKVIQE